MGGDILDPCATQGIEEPVIGRWAGDRIAVIGDYAEDGDIKGPLPDPLSTIYGLCCKGVYRDVTPLVRPVLAAELGVEYYTQRYTGKFLSGDEQHCEIWRFRRDPSAAYSVLE